MITKAHTLEFSAMKPWPPDADLPTPAQDLDALYQAAQTAWNAYVAAAREWENGKEPARLAAWKAYFERVGYPKDATYKDKLDAQIAAFEPKVVVEEPAPVEEPIP